MLGKIRGLCEQVAGGLDAEISLAESTTPMVEQSRSFVEASLLNFVA